MRRQIAVLLLTTFLSQLSFASDFEDHFFDADAQQLETYKKYLKDYRSYAVIDACYQARQGYSLAYIPEEQMQRVERKWDEKKKKHGLSEEDQEYAEFYLKADMGFNLQIMDVSSSMYNTETSGQCSFHLNVFLR